MSAGIVNLKVDQGSTFVLPITLEELQDDGVTYLPMSLVGYTARAQVRATYASTVVAAQFSFSALDATGIFEATLTAIQTAAMAAGDYFWDLELVQGDYVLKLLKGKFTLEPEVTR